MHDYPTQVPHKAETSRNRGEFWQPWARGGVRFGLTISGLLFAALFETLTLQSIALGSLLILLSMPLQFWAKGCLHQNQILTTFGPYRFVRHPFYTSSLMLDLGIMVMTGSLIFVTLGLVWWLAVYRHAIAREEQILHQIFAHAYADYARRIPALLPWKRALPARPYRIDFTRYNITVTEIPRAIQALVFPLLFLLAFWLDRPQFAFDLSNGVIVLWLITSVLSLFACARIWRLAFKHDLDLVPRAGAQASARTVYVFAIVVAGLVWSQFDPMVDPWLHRLPGILMLGMAMLLMLGPDKARLVAEAGVALGLAILLELEWASLLLAPLYLSIILMQWRPAPGDPPQDSNCEALGPLLLSSLMTLGLVSCWLAEFRL